MIVAVLEPGGRLRPLPGQTTAAGEPLDAARFPWPFEAVLARIAPRVGEFYAFECVAFATKTGTNQAVASGRVVAIPPGAHRAHYDGHALRFDSGDGLAATGTPEQIETSLRAAGGEIVRFTSLGTRCAFVWISPEATAALATAPRTRRRSAPDPEREFSVVPDLWDNTIHVAIDSVTYVGINVMGLDRDLRNRGGFETRWDGDRRVAVRRASTSTPRSTATAPTETDFAESFAASTTPAGARGTTHVIRFGPVVRKPEPAPATKATEKCIHGVRRERCRRCAPNPW